MNENKLEDSKGFAALLRLVRPKQWIKNGFIFLPLFFGGALLHTDALLVHFSDFSEGVILWRWGKQVGKR